MTGVAEGGDGGPFVTVVSVDGGSITGNKLTVKTPAASPTIPLIPEEDSTQIEDSSSGGSAYVTVVALGKEQIPGEKTSVVNILNEVEACLREELLQYSLPEDLKKKSVVSIEDVEEELILYRLPGERLGLGLRFECGNDPHDRVSRLFIETCAEGSPAERAIASWGHLGAGDEVLAIDGVPISKYTRQSLIDTLREAPVALCLRIRHLCTHQKKDFDNFSMEDRFRLISEIQEALKVNEEETSLGDSVQDSTDEEPLWIEDSKGSATPLRHLTPRDSLRYHRNHRPASLHLEPPQGFEDNLMKSLSLEDVSAHYDWMKSRSSLGQYSPLDPPPSFQDDGVVGKKKIVRSRSLVNITHEDTTADSQVPQDEPRPNHPQEQESEPRDEGTGKEFCEDEVDPEQRDVGDVEEGDELDSFAAELGGAADEDDDGEVTIRIEWLHEIEEEACPSPVEEGDLGESYQTTVSAVEQILFSDEDFNEDKHTTSSGFISEIEKFQFSGQNVVVTNELLLLKALPLGTIQFDQNPTILPITRRTSLTEDLSWSEGRGMESSLEFEFIPPTHARLPPDGHESPNGISNNWAEQNYMPPPLPTTQPPDDDPPPLPASGPPTAPRKRSLRDNKGYDETDDTFNEPSIRSVKDKIALFSSSSDEYNGDFQKPSINNNSVPPAAAYHAPELNTQLEERRKCISRLRGLVLCEQTQTQSPLLDLPPIRSKDAPLITSTIPKIQPVVRTVGEPPNKELPPEITNQWKVSHSIPKYSPAFKRRTLTPYLPKTQTRSSEGNNVQRKPFPVNESVLLFSTNGKEEKDESDKDSAVPSSPPSSLPQEISVPNSPLPTEETTDSNQGAEDSIFNGIEQESKKGEKEFVQSPLQAIFDMEVQMAYVNEICDALPSGGGGYFNKRRDSEVTVIERNMDGHQDNNRKSPGREIQTHSFTKESPSSPQWSPGSVKIHPPTHSTPVEKSAKVAGILEKKIERIIEKTTTEGVVRSKPSTTASIPRGRNDFKSLAEKWQQISTQPTKPNEPKSRDFNTPQRKRTLSVTDIRRAFEKSEESIDSFTEESKSPPELLSPPSAHFRVSSFDSTTSEESSTPGTSFLSSVPRDPYGSITSLASSTSLISPQELQQLIEEANQSLEEAGTPTHEVSVLILHREFAGGSLGITLAGGADYETKEITVHKVLTGSIADRDGRIYRGDRVLSINGKNTKGLTHREALNLLKAPRCEVVLVVSRGRSGSNSFSTIDETMVCLDRAVEPLLNGTLGTYENDDESPLAWGPTKTVILMKDGAGLGFSLDGGKGSILGDKPLTIKKIFVGGPAEKSRGLAVGDLITAINGTKMCSKSRTEAWNFMKKLGDGEVTLCVRSPIQSSVNNGVQN